MGYELKRRVKTSELCAAVGMQFDGDDIVIKNVAPSNVAAESTLCFTRNASELSSGVVAIAGDVDGVNGLSCTVIRSTNPRLDFIRCLDWLVNTVGFATWDFESKIDGSARIHPSAVIEPGCAIGPHVIIEPNVTIHSGTRIGARSRIRSNSSIGGDGFGFERLEGNQSVRFPHLGGVLIGEDVEIGACTCIAKGTLSDTVIRDHAKVDNLVHIAHNCDIKNGAYVIAGAEVSGGVVVGENAWVSPNACVLQKVEIGNDALVGIGAVVTKSVQPGAVVAGNPAKELIKKP